MAILAQRTISGYVPCLVMADGDKPVILSHLPLAYDESDDLALFFPYK